MSMTKKHPQCITVAHHSNLSVGFVLGTVYTPSSPRYGPYQFWSTLMESKDKDFRKTQQDLTELNGEGNRQRGHEGEDESGAKPDVEDSKEEAAEKWRSTLGNRGGHANE